MLAMQVFAVFVSGFSARQASLDNARETVAGHADREVDNVVRFLEPAERLVADTVKLIERGVISDNGVELADYLSARLSSMPQISSAFVGIPDGPVSVVARQSDTLRRSETTAASMPDRMLLAPTGDGIVWSQPYVFGSSDRVGVTASQAITVDGTVVAVVGVDIELSALSAALTHRWYNSEEETFVVSSGLVIAGPRDLVDADASNADRTPPLKTPADFGLAYTASASDGSERIAVASENEFVAHRTLPATSNTQWEVIVRAPESAFTDLASDQQKVTLILTLGGAAMLIVAMLALWRITTPIRTLQEQAATDPLTGLANRRQISSIGQSMLRERRTNERIAVLTLDLDEFKALNDIHGHHMGDHALCVVADRLTTLTRRGDLVGRLGGDEFVVALPIQETNEGLEIANRILRQLNDTLHLRIPQCELGVTAGLAMSDDIVDEIEPADFDQLLLESDAALRRAKLDAKGMMMVSDRLLSESIPLAQF